MTSPFPGMDPYIEACGVWRDFHNKLIYNIDEYLAKRISNRYIVRMDERSFQSQSSVPLTLRAFIENEFRESYVEIYEATPEQRLVTTIEVLSPSNKQLDSAGWNQYVRKRQAALIGRVNLVEIDLLRGGQRMPMLDAWPDCPYYLLVGRAKRGPECCQVWPADYRTPLPIIPVPLIPPDPDILLDLQAFIPGIYQRARYDATIDYTRPLQPPLPPEDLAWLREQLKRRSE